MLEADLFDGVTRIRMSRELDGRPVYWVAAYLVDGLLIDTGCSHTADELASFLEGKTLDLVINTHFHEDHTGANRLVKERYKVPVYAHHLSIPHISKGFPLYPYQEIAWGYPQPSDVLPIPDIIRTRGHTFTVVETPGHCEGHVCLIEQEKGWCFSGDLFARENPKFTRPEEDMGKTIASMQGLIDMPSERLVLFTSLGRIIEDGRASLGRCIDYLKTLSARAHDLYGSGLGLEEIVGAVFGGENPFAQLTDGQFSSANLVRSMLETIPRTP